jgi:nucleotide-binding universal stress UspA family protein
MSFSSQEGNSKMSAAQKIMVAVGFTEYSEGLLSYAAGIADSMGAEMIVASIINSRDVEAVGTIAAMGYEVDGEHYVSGVKEERRQALEQMLKKISFPAARIREVFKVGHPVEELLKIAVEENVDLIVMGIKCRSNLEHVLVGSVAEKIFRRSPVPILSYRDSKSATRLKKHIGIK